MKGVLGGSRARRRAGWLIAAGIGPLFGCTPAPRVELTPEEQALVLDALPSDVQHRTSIDFEGKVQLLGYDLLPASNLAPGSAVTLRLYWQSQRPLAHNWRLFTHLTERGQPLTNLDKAGALRNSAALEPSAWQPGKVYVDEQPFTLPAAADITILAGVWNEQPINDPHPELGRASGARDALTDEVPSAGRLTERGERRPEEAQTPRRAAVGLRLQVISGPEDGENRAIIAHLRPGAADKTF